MEHRTHFIPLDHWGTLQCRLVWAYDRPFPTGYKRWTYIPTPDVAWLIQEGSVMLDFSSGKEHYTSGTWVFPKNENGTQEFSQDARILSLRFHVRWPSGIPLFERDRSFSTPSEDVPEFTQDAKALVEAVDDLLPKNKTTLVTTAVSLMGNLDAYLSIQPLLLKCVAGYYFILTDHKVVPNIPGTIDKRALQALHYIDTQPLDAVLHEQDLAKRVGLSVSQLNRIFVRDLRTTPAAAWNKRKLAAACDQLTQSSASIKQIAFSVGFSSPEHFSSWFRKQTNSSPRQYRQKFHTVFG